jgi:1-acyl-sn-glycerol-3-phosphate acyltransferase
LQKLISVWIYLILRLLKAICKIDWEIEGKENLINQPCIIVSNHQGPWESLFLQTLIVPSTSIVKKELLLIPFFGWGVACTEPITVDRSKKFKSLKRVVSKAKLKLKKGFSIILFPEGTRVKPEKGIQKFGSSCGLISYENKVPIIPICHNSGKYWRNKEFKKYSGTVKLRIGKPIEALSAKDATNKAYEWIKLNYQAIN